MIQKHALWIWTALLGFLPIVVHADGNITLKGSDTMVLLCQKWAEVYMREHSGVTIQVTGGGSGIGIAALRNNSTDIASASRPMKPEEIAGVLTSHGERPLEVKTAMDGLCVFVNQENPLQEISFEQLAKIFRGEVKNWSEVGGPDMPVVVYSRENSSGTYAYFKEEVLKGDDYTARALTMPGTAALINAISKDKSGIGYGGVGYASGVKVLAVRKGNNDPAIKPSDETIHNHTYPLARYLFFYTLPSSNKGEIGNFIKWVTGSEGQEVVKEIGYYPLSHTEATVAVAPVGVPQASTPTVSATLPAAEFAVAKPAVLPVAIAAPQPSSAGSIADILQTLIDREVLLARREMAASQREETIANREAVLAKLEAAMIEREKKVTPREMQIAAREAELNQMEATLNDRAQKLSETKHHWF